jgi:hypothetical protein
LFSAGGVSFFDGGLESSEQPTPDNNKKQVKIGLIIVHRLRATTRRGSSLCSINASRLCICFTVEQFAAQNAHHDPCSGNIRTSQWRWRLTQVKWDGNQRLFS